MALLGALALVFYSCGSHVDTQKGPPPVSSKYKLLLFAAPWCIECGPELQSFKPMWLNESKTTTDRYSVKLYVVSNDQKTQPTDSDAQQYRASLDLPFEAAADTWKWKTYRSSVTDKNGKSYTWSLPAAVVQTDKGEKVKVFVGSQPDQLMTYLRELVKEN